MTIHNIAPYWKNGSVCDLSILPSANYVQEQICDLFQCILYFVAAGLLETNNSSSVCSGSKLSSGSRQRHVQRRAHPRRK